MLSLLSIYTFNVYGTSLRLALNWKPEPQFGGFYAAEIEGHNKTAGLEVKILEGGSGTPTVQMLAAGQVDYAVVSADEVAMAHDRGATEVVAIFATFQTNPQCIMTHAERGYKELGDLIKDSKALLLWQAGLPYALYLKKKMQPFRVRTAPFSGGIANFKHDKSVAQQCFATSEPLTAEREGIASKIFLISEIGYNPYTTVLVTRRSRLKNQREEVQKMVAAVRKGWESYLADPSKTNAHMHSLNKAMNLATFAASARAQQELIQPKVNKMDSLGRMTSRRWKELVAQLRTLGLIHSNLETDQLYESL